jgi:hypothetical protein
MLSNGIDGMIGWSQNRMMSASNAIRLKEAGSVLKCPSLPLPGFLPGKAKLESSLG